MYLFNSLRGPPLLSGLVYTYKSAVQGSNLKHIYAVIAKFCIIFVILLRKVQNNGEVWPI